MREILFKAKRVDNGKWLEGYYQKRFDDFGNIQHLIFYSKSATVWGYAEIYIDTLCQYTGLKDKNGKQIWENDIVFVTDDDGNSGQVDTGIGKIDFLEGLWYISGRVQNSLYDIYKSFQIEVIGNTFDNPELLEVRDSMQNDLISRQAVIDLLQKNMSNDIQDNIITENNINLICSIPTAFNVEKVVAELKEWTFNADVNIGDGTIMNHNLIANENAIDIVKRGGVNNCDVCEWIYNDEYDFAKSECGAIDTMRIAFRKWKYCPYCGKKIKVVE